MTSGHSIFDELLYSKELSKRNCPKQDHVMFFGIAQIAQADANTLRQAVSHGHVFTNRADQFNLTT